MVSSDDDKLYRDADLAQFYDLENLWAADQDFCVDLAREANSVLDLGCGTGVLAAELGKTRDVVGADPAGAMLEIARQRPGGDRVTWIECDAQSLRLDRRFDLIVLTGHAFQVFLTEDGRLAVLRTIAHHLTPNGRFVFDSRNPAFEDWRSWTPEESRRCFEHPTLGTIEAHNDVTYDSASDIATYETHYRVVADGRTYAAASQIGFPSKETLERLIARARLAVDQWLGDWEGGPYTADGREIIPIGRLA